MKYVCLHSDSTILTLKVEISSKSSQSISSCINLKHSSYFSFLILRSFLYWGSTWSKIFLQSMKYFQFNGNVNISLTSWDPVSTAFRMLMEDENVSGCGEGGADMLLVWEEQEAWHRVHIVDDIDNVDIIDTSHLIIDGLSTSGWEGEGGRGVGPQGNKGALQMSCIFFTRVIRIE